MKMGRPRFADRRAAVLLAPTPTSIPRRGLSRPPRQSRKDANATRPSQALRGSSELHGSATFRVLIRRLYAGHELVVWSVEGLAKPVYARQDRVMAVHNGTTEALDS
jgi:hypothetical protein